MLPNYFLCAYLLIILFVVLFQCFPVGVFGAASDSQIDQKTILQTIMKKYDWRVRPNGLNSSWPGTNGPVIVMINMLIRSISKIDDVNMEYSIQITFREEWVDPRLAYKNRKGFETAASFVVLPPGETIWMPDSFFQNEKQARKHNIDTPNVLIRIYNDGSILYSVRLSMVLSCPMNLKYYPMDVQSCLIDVASYAYTTNDIVYDWKGNGKNSIQIKSGVKTSMPSFELTNVTTGYCTSKTNTGEYSCLRVQMRLERQFSYYLLQLYIPSTMLVIVSWVSFWLDRSAVPARVTLGVTTLLTMTTQASGINAKLPPVSYTKAIDIWIGACMGFIFGALLEFAFVTYVGDKDTLKAKKRAAGEISKKEKKAAAVTGAKLDASFLKQFSKASPKVLPNIEETKENGRRHRSLSPARSRAVGLPQAPPPPASSGSSNSKVVMSIEEQQRLPLLEAGNDPQVLSAYQDGSAVWIRINGEEAPWYSMRSHSPSSYNRTQQGASLLAMILKPYTFVKRKLINAGDRSKRIDYVCRIVFPFGFILFNMFYWTAFSNTDVIKSEDD